MIDPNEFVITRKRKKYKFAKFANSPLCFEFEQWKKKTADVVELGAGDGLFAVALAEKYPNKTFVAIDVKADRLQKGAYEAEAKNLENIVFLRARADQVIELFLEKSVQQIWLNFSDPFPKKRSAKRRMTHRHYLALYKSVLAEKGELLTKHDDLDFFQWSLEQLVQNNWRIQELSFDLHEADLSGDYSFLTTYEKRWQKEGRQTYFVRAQLL